MTSINLLNSTKIEILKSATTNNISITAINHYSEAQLDLIKSDWMLFLITLACVVGIVVLVLVVVCFIVIKKLKKKNKNTLDELAGMVMTDKLRKTNPDLFNNLDEDELSMVSSFRHSYEGKSSERKQSGMSIEVEEEIKNLNIFEPMEQEGE